MLDFEKNIIVVWLFVKMIKEILCFKFCTAMKIINIRSCNLTAKTVILMSIFIKKFFFIFKLSITVVASTLSLITLSFVYIIKDFEFLIILSCFLKAMFLSSIILYFVNTFQNKVTQNWILFINSNVLWFTLSCASYFFSTCETNFRIWSCLSWLWSIV